ncbi:MAG: transcription termination factor Rho [Bowdeniella nasicola]|nr:transcription termination factor Rho [Bowdeniella nasicola]
MRLSELQELAQSMGIDIAKKRRQDLMSEIREARGSSRPAKRSERAGKKPADTSAETKSTGRADAGRDEKSSGADASSETPARQDGRGSKGSAREGRDDGDGNATPSLKELEEAAARKRERRSENTEGEERRDRRRDRSERDDQRGGRGRDSDRDDQRGGRNNRRRNRDRGRGRHKRDRRDRRDDSQGPEIREDDVLMPMAGILDVLDNYAFVRTTGYLPGENDVYVTLGQVRKYGMRRGDAVTGKVRQPRPDDRRGNRQKYNPLVAIDTINGRPVDEMRDRPQFGKLTPLYPKEHLRLETTPRAITARMIDLVAPIGKGQRGLIVAPPKAGKTIVMQQIANAIAVNNPEVHLMVVLVDERPEEVTDMQRMVKGEVIASTFDRPASDHTIVAELAVERAKRLVELGKDVVVLLDSLTRLSRAYNLAAPASGRILSGGVDASALYPPKRFFGAARNIEDGGSLTILASALVETGSKMDEVIFEEFKGTGNSELRLSRFLADKRMFPAVDVNASGTRREELLVQSDALKVMWRLRRLIAGLEKEQALELMLNKLRDTQSNAEFLMSILKTTPAGRDENSSGEVN